MVFANKADLSSQQDLDRLRVYLDSHCAANVEMQPIEYGSIDIALLNERSSWSVGHKTSHHTDPEYVPAADLPMPACGFLRADNAGEGFESVGWRFSADKIFDHTKVSSLLKCIQAERIKAVMITDAGVFGYNISGTAFSEVYLDDCMESRLEIICQKSDSQWERALMGCLLAE